MLVVKLRVVPAAELTVLLKMMSLWLVVSVVLAPKTTGAL